MAGLVLFCNYCFVKNIAKFRLPMLLLFRIGLYLCMSVYFCICLFGCPMLSVSYYIGVSPSFKAKIRTYTKKTSIFLMQIFLFSLKQFFKMIQSFVPKIANKSYTRSNRMWDTLYHN